MTQSRVDSVMETVTNTAIGYGIAVFANAVILPVVLDVKVSLGENLFIAALFTVISLIRGYLIRRAFNGRSVWQSIKARIPCTRCRGSGNTQEFNAFFGSFEIECIKCAGTGKRL